MGLPPGDSKEPALRQLAELFREQTVPYAVIGGIAVQVWTEEQRTTKDIDIAVDSYEAIPFEALEEAGWEYEGRFDHSDNWRAPGPEPRKLRTPLQFSVPQQTKGAVENALEYSLPGGGVLRVVDLPDLLSLKVEAALEPRRRASKRVSDYADIQRLIEEHPDLAQEVVALPDLLEQIEALIVKDRKRNLSR